jgi:hypothetical protein
MQLGVNSLTAIISVVMRSIMPARGVKACAASWRPGKVGSAVMLLCMQALVAFLLGVQWDDLL